MNGAPDPSILMHGKDVTKTYGTGRLAIRVLHGVTLEVRPGEFCLLVGPSGSGKTTLVSILTGLARPTSGSVELCGVPISDRPERAVWVRREKVGLIFQGFNLFPGLSALENVAAVAGLKGGLSRREALLQARNALEAVGLSGRLDNLPGQLSGGEQQRVAVARALVGRPRLLVGDEPTAALDSSTAMTVMETLRDHADAGCAMLIVTHDTRLERFADRVIQLEDGTIRGERAGDLPLESGPSASR